jgi:hypothetical protein
VAPNKDQSDQNQVPVIPLEETIIEVNHMGEIAQLPTIIPNKVAEMHVEKEDNIVGKQDNTVEIQGKAVVGEGGQSQVQS